MIWFTDKYSEKGKYAINYLCNCTDNNRNNILYAIRKLGRLDMEVKQALIDLDAMYDVLEFEGYEHEWKVD